MAVKFVSSASAPRRPFLCYVLLIHVTGDAASSKKSAPTPAGGASEVKINEDQLANWLAKVHSLQIPLSLC
jgi:hypothetical protein